MPEEGAEGQQPSRTEQGGTHKYKEKLVQYLSGHLAVSITGELGSKYDFSREHHKYNPAVDNEAIISTSSGNDYYIAHDRNNGTYIVNIRETERQGKLISIYTKEFPAPIPSVEFGKPWELPSFYTTTDIKELLLKYKVTDPKNKMGRELGTPSPFTKYKQLLHKYRPDVVL